MKTTNCISQLKQCRTFAEASRILESNGVKKSAVELLRLGFAVKANQPDIFENNLQTVIQEIEDELKKKEEEVTEVDGGVSHDSSKIDGLDDVAKRTPESDTEGAELSSGEDQMKEMGGQMYPPQPQQPPGMVQPPQQQRPPMMPPQQQQMQYARQIDASMKKMAHRVTELEKAALVPKSLEIGSKIGKPNFSSLMLPIQETVSDKTVDGVISNRKGKVQRLQEVRSDIAQYNSYLNDNKITPGTQ